MYGRSDAGVSHINIGHASPTAAIAAPPTSSCLTAVTRPFGATQNHASARPGTTSSAAAIFVSNPSPTNTPLSTSHLRLPPLRRPRSSAHTAPTRHSTSSASGLLWREIATVIGVSASVRPATKPAWRPNRERARSYVSPTVATPISACGTSNAHALNPNARADNACTHSASGGLSTVCSPAASNEP